MKVAIIVLAVVVVVLVATMVLIGSGVHISGFKPPPTKSDGSVDQDALSNWKPPSIAQFISNAGSVFAPHANFGTKSVVVAAGSPRLISAKRSKNDVDIAQLQVSNGALLVTYVCKRKKDDSDCSQTMCLCKPGSQLTALAIAACKDDSRWKQAAAAPGICSADEQVTGKIIVYPEARDVSLTALGPSATVSLK